MKCQYCGSESILLPDGSSVKFRSEVMCPKCGAVNDKSSWFCTSCSTVLTSDSNVLKELKKKIAFIQEDTRNSVPPWLKQKLLPDELIYFFYSLKKGDFYLVTNRRMLKCTKSTFREARLCDVVSVGDVHIDPGLSILSGYMYLARFNVQTFQGDVIFETSISVVAPSQVGDFKTLHSWATQALQNYNQRKKDIRELILRLKLEQENDQTYKEKGDQISESASCGKCSLFGSPTDCAWKEKNPEAGTCLHYSMKA